jgi:hypothetical protein
MVVMRLLLTSFENHWQAVPVALPVATASGSQHCYITCVGVKASKTISFSHKSILIKRTLVNIIFSIRCTLDLCVFNRVPSSLGLL